VHVMLGFANRRQEGKRGEGRKRLSLLFEDKTNILGERDGERINRVLSKIEQRNESWLCGFLYVSANS
jgi:hypothetical protein